MRKVSLGRFASVSASVLSLSLLISACASNNSKADPTLPASSIAPSATEQASTASEIPTKEMTIKFDPQGYLPRESTTKDPAVHKVMQELADEYTKLKPNIKIEFVEVTAPDRKAWLQARMLSKDAPDIFWTNFEETWTNYQKGWFLQMDPWLNKPNPYNDNQIWKDTFVPGIIDAVRAPDGSAYTIPGDGVAIGIYYNKTIFDKLSLTVPTTWTEFIEVQEKIKASGVIPMAFSTESASSGPWSDTIMHSEFMLDKITDMDTSGNGRLEPNELVKAIKEGKFPLKEVVNQEYSLMKEWSQYWPKGFNAQIDEEQMFESGKAAMWMAGNAYSDYLNKSDFGFDYGVFSFPAITQDVAPAASGQAAKIYGPWGPAQWLVPGYLNQEDPDKVAAIIDFLMFLSSPDHMTQISAEGLTIPNIVGAVTPKGQEPFVNDIPLTIMQGYHAILDAPFKDKMKAAIQFYLNGDWTIDKFSDEVMKYYTEAADRMAEANPDWLK